MSHLDILAAGAGGLLGGLLGGVGSQKSEFKIKKIPRWTPEQQKIFEDMLSIVGGGLGKPWALKPTPEEKEYRAFLAGYEPWYRGLASEIYSPEATKEYFKKVIYPEWEEEVFPRIQAQYAGPGYWGSARTEAIRKSLSELGRQESTALFETEMGRRQMLSGLPSLLSTTKAALADWGRKFAKVEPLLSPYFTAAGGMLGYEPYYILGGITQPQPSPLYGLGQALGFALPSLLAGATSGGALTFPSMFTGTVSPYASQFASRLSGWYGTPGMGLIY